MAKINFSAKLEQVGPFTIVRLPLSVSDKLPSRGLVMVEGTIDGYEFQSPLEPTGQKSHWLKLDQTMKDAIGAKAGNEVTLSIEPSKAWPEPDVPEDLQAALDNDPEAKAVWQATTPMARWDWIRSVRSTRNPETRARRIKVACSKLRSGKPRQCCFNRSECTEPAVSRGGVLIDTSA